MREGVQPDGIIISISAKMIKERGYRNWLRNYLSAMDRDDMYYYMRQGNQPKREVQFVYLAIGGKVRFRSYFAGSRGAGLMTFTDGKQLFGNAWVILAGPVERAPKGMTFPFKGRQGFRYTEKLF